MVRFTWAIGDGLNASASKDDLSTNVENVRHITVDIEVSGQYPLEGIFTIPANGYIDQSKVWMVPLATVPKRNS